MVANEFWEQGDLERTVLQQQPIVSTKYFNCVKQYCLLFNYCIDDGPQLLLVHYNQKHDLNYCYSVLAHDGQKQR